MSVASKNDLRSALEAYADGSGDLDLRLFFGASGYRIEVRNETQDTGQGWLSPGYLLGLLQAVGAILDSNVKEENLDVTDPLGVTSFTLAKEPVGDAHLLVFKNGALLRRGVNYSRTGKNVSLVGALNDWFYFWYRYAS